MTLVPAADYLAAARNLKALERESAVASAKRLAAREALDVADREQQRASERHNAAYLAFLALEPAPEGEARQ